jgi:murein DD-endopeptidase MepM/ murein hydrolase activator NlpD
MVMRKKNDPRVTKSNLTKFINQKINNLRQIGTSSWQNARPFLAPKYWPVYFIAFGIGFYLWGPTQGWQKFQSWQSRQTQNKAKLPDTETLQLQLNRLKQELQTAQNEKKTPAFDPTSFSRPTLGQVIRGFDWVKLGNSWRLHTGVDIKVPPGSNVLASAAGSVIEIKELAPEDYMVSVSHGDGWKSTYSSLAKVMVIDGQSVINGVIIGTTGNKGCDPLVPTFHFALYHDQQPVDPEKIIDGL